MNRLERPSVRDGYDKWSSTYDSTPNPLISLDRRYTIQALAPIAGESVLDLGCGTGGHLETLCAAHCRVVGLDFSLGMLRVAKSAVPLAGLARADLNQTFPIRRGAFDAILSTLVSEHLVDLRTFFTEVYSTLRKGGRFVFSAFHPALARCGIEANFQQDGVEYRLGAEPHTVDDYLNHISDAGFTEITCREYSVDQQLVEQVPWAGKYGSSPLLLVIRAECAP